MTLVVGEVCRACVPRARGRPRPRPERSSRARILAFPARPFHAGLARAARRSRRRAPLQGACSGQRTTHAPAPPSLARGVSRSLRARRLRHVDVRAWASGSGGSHDADQRVGLDGYSGRSGREPGRLPVRWGLRAHGVLSRRGVHERRESEALRGDVHAGLPARDHRLRRRLPLPRGPLRGQADEHRVQVIPFPR